MGLLEGKLALISGVTNKSSIGWSLAKALHAHGARIAFTCVEGNLRRVRKLAPEVQSDLVYVCDVRNDEAVASAVARVGEAFGGKLDVFVHAIAYADLKDLGGEFIRISREGWITALDVSAYSLVAFSRAIRPLMVAAGGGSIMSLTFAGGDKVVPGYNIMGIAKAALDMSVRYLAYDLGGENIRVNLISPGPIATPSSLVVEDFETARTLVETHSPLLRNISGEDIGGTAVFLASDLSRGITGARLRVDSGMNIVAPPSVIHKRLKKSQGAM